MQQFVLGTVSKLVRVMERLPINAPLAQKLKFKIADRLCPAHLFTLISGIMLMKHMDGQNDHLFFP